MSEKKIDYKRKYENLKKEYEDFIYIISHDMNSPLRHIRVFMDILLADIKDNVTKDQLEAKEFIKISISQIDNMMESLLKLSRIKYQKESWLTMNTRTALENAVQNCKKIIPDADAMITLPNNCPDIYGDFDLICQLFFELLSNGIKASIENAKPYITVEIQEKDSTYIFSFRDQGCGINEDYFEKIFQIFKKMSSESAALGVGLTYAKKIVNLHDGDIWLESKKGEGSCFYVRLPINNISKNKD